MKKTALKNRYFLMRHGHSVANEKGIIISSPVRGTSEYGLSEKGKKQVLTAAENFRGDAPLFIYASDFLRTAETAALLGEALGIDKIIFTEKLRERFFGEYEGKSNSFYSDIWKRDIVDCHNNDKGVESPVHVARRTESLINELEQRHKNCSLILVSHGDCLQILQTVFQNVPPETHRSLRHLETAEIREMAD
ncbi:histidine phosphatase family protein [Spirochaeta isovalerica]|uniref:Putative phosphoglycerate mutase n=1 Tax=Spirochaeta isovalerica TaxID=150 RepID=A0A841RDS9_9SPIO|nr:histidine phosphatase family protein [Spirochaeta isovalerica]MBB6481377.1 putative phosphoglycerate mutase [Spirochaeta isovalerica]